MSILAIDGGASAAKWRLQAPDGSVLAQGTTSPLHGHIYAPKDKQTARALLTEIRAALPAGIVPDQIVGGIAGLAANSPATRWYFREIREVFAIDPAHIFVSDDLGMVFLGNFEPGQGMVLYAGTGAIACHVTRDFQVKRAGGYGHLIDDKGSGYWIGKTALKLFLRGLEESRDVSSSPLFSRLAAQFGGTDWDKLKPQIYDGGRPLIASLTLQVNAAAQDGDSTALSILRQAGHALADLANRLSERLRPPVRQVAFLGGVTRTARLVADPLAARLNVGLTLAPSAIGDAQAMCRATEKYGADGLRQILSGQTSQM